MKDPLAELTSNALAGLDAFTRANTLPAGVLAHKAEWLPDRQQESEEDPSLASSFPFLVTKTTDLTATMRTGSVELGPATVLTWAGARIINGTVNAASGCFTNNLTSTSNVITVPSGNTVWYVWANVDIRDGAEAWSINEGATITPLSDSETQGENVLKNTRQKIIAQLTIVDDIITEIENIQCGNIDIPRL